MRIFASMKIAVAQIRPIKGDIDANITSHLKLAQLAAVHGAKAVFFPELSITGYEPTLAKDLAANVEDKRLDVFQDASNKNNITIAVGMPIRGTNGVLITMIIFQPNLPRQAYSKQHLHSDEVPFFINGDRQVFLNYDGQKIAPGICYETSLPVHWENAHQNGANLYVASVSKTAAGMEKLAKFFSEMAKKYSIHVLLSNSIGHEDDFMSAGRSAAWDNEGKMLAQLDDINEGILVYDTETNQTIQQTTA
jgi:predicted amidohydrolase